MRALGSWGRPPRARASAGAGGALAREPAGGEDERTPIQYIGVRYIGVAVTSPAVRKPTIREVLATNIRREALARGVGLNALADLAGVSRSGLYSVLAEETAATVDWVEKVAGALGVEVARLVRGEPRT